MVALLVAPCDNMNYVMIDTNHVTIDDFDVIIDRKYITKDDTYANVDVVVDTKENYVPSNFCTMQ